MEIYAVLAIILGFVILIMALESNEPYGSDIGCLGAVAGLVLAACGILGIRWCEDDVKFANSACTDVTITKLKSSYVYEGCGFKIEKEQYGINEKPEQFNKFYVRTITKNDGSVRKEFSLYSDKGWQRQ